MSGAKEGKRKERPQTLPSGAGEEKEAARKRLLSGSETLFGRSLAVTQCRAPTGAGRLVLIGVIHLPVSLTGGP